MLSVFLAFWLLYTDGCAVHRDVYIYISIVRNKGGLGGRVKILGG
jgi:hypothetical protein